MDADSLNSFLPPLTKLRIFREARKITLQLMEDNVITPARATEILSYLQEHLDDIDSRSAAKGFCLRMCTAFPELEKLEAAIETEEEEQIDRAIGHVITFLMERGDFEAANGVIDRAKVAGKDVDTLLRELHELYPDAAGTAE